MTTSTNLLDYIGKGTLASRPATPTLNTGCHGFYWATDVSQLSLWDGSAWHENITAGSAPSSGVLNGLVSGGQVVWETGLQFRVSAATYYIGGTLYSSTAQTITLSAADATHDRIDVIAVDTSGNVVKIDGVATAAPTEPDVNPATQLKLKFVQVAATATSPSGTSTENVYLENTEWTTSTSGSGFTVASTNNPYAGTKDIEGTSVASNAYVQLQRASSETLDTVDSLNLFIRSKAAWTSGRGLRLQFYLNGVAKGTAVTLSQGYWGFDSSQTSTYQFVAIPISQFVLPAGTSINQLRITDFGGSIGFYIDNITLTSVATSIGGGGESGISQAQADARYLQLIGGTTTGDISVPDEAYDATNWNGSLEVPTKNAVRDKIETLAAATVTTTGSPASGNLAKFSGATSVTNGNLSGDVTTSGALTATIANDAVTYAKMQNVSATKRVIGRNTAGSGDPEEVTVDQLLDWITGTAAQGDVFYRGSTGIKRLAAGTTGQILQTNGSSADPSWVTPNAASGGAAGTAFPGTPATGDRFYRTDRGIEYYYDGTRWLSMQLMVLLGEQRDTASAQPLTTNTAGNDRMLNPWSGVYDIYVLDFIMSGVLTSGTTASNYYTGRLNKDAAAVETALGSGLSCQNDTQNTHTSHREAINAVVASTTQNFNIAYTKVGSTVTYYVTSAITYRLVG